MKYSIPTITNSFEAQLPFLMNVLQSTRILNKPLSVPTMVIISPYSLPQQCIPMNNSYLSVNVLYSLIVIVINTYLITCIQQTAFKKCMVTLTNGVIQWEYRYYCYCYYIIYIPYNTPLSAEQPLPIRYHQILGILHSWNHCQLCYCYSYISIIVHLLPLTVDSHQYRVSYYVMRSKQRVFDGILFIYSV